MSGEQELGELPQADTLDTPEANSTRWRIRYRGRQRDRRRFSMEQGEESSFWHEERLGDEGQRENVLHLTGHRSLGPYGQAEYRVEFRLDQAGKLVLPILCETRYEGGRWQPVDDEELYTAIEQAACAAIASFPSDPDAIRYQEVLERCFHIQNERLRDIPVMDEL